MALKTLIPFPITTTTTPTTPHTTTTTTTEIRFSRWHNPNVEKLHQTRRTQHQIEEDLRRLRRFESAVKISTTLQNPPQQQPPPFKSTGTPSSPSRSSIPAKKSKYSKNPSHSQRQSQRSSHPAFRNVLDPNPVSIGETDIRVGENGLTYVVPGAPFEFMYSYTETPKNVRPVGLREPAVTPFGPGTMPRPWTGRKPLPGTKKKLPEFDSFKVPESGKKGIKTVQKPGPFLPGTGPRYVKSREEMLGEPLTVEEVKELVEGCRKTKRQLNMGRDGLTHNMLDNIHAHWKRRRVCKIKCLGVCTVDMDNVCQQLEEKTGGKIIYRRGGIVYLFRGRNYNYKTRPRFPLMLWKPVTPVYPRLINRVPEGLTLQEANDMRKRGRELIPICKLGKNGVYVKLVKNVREAFEECELVRINCQGLNPSDYRKIGAKLKDLVPCVLISFENEHILMWRGRDWKPSIPMPEDSIKGDKSSETDGSSSLGSSVGNSLDSEDEDDDDEDDNDVGVDDDVVGGVDGDDDDDVGPFHSSNISNEGLSDGFLNVRPNKADDIEVAVVTKVEDRSFVKDGSELDANVSNNVEVPLPNSPIDSTTEYKSKTSSQCTKGVVDLLRQAVESGRAAILNDGSSLDADLVYERSVAFAKGAPPGPIFRYNLPKVAVKKFENRKTSNVEAGKVEAEVEVEAEVMPVVSTVKKSNEKNSKEQKRSKIDKGKDFENEFVDIVPQGSLRIDELAKLLAS